MSLSHYLFGDFSVEYRSSLAVSEAVGRLAALADQSILPSPSAYAPLHGYVTRHEMFLYQGSMIFVNPFRPRFTGAFFEKNGMAVLRGRFVAMLAFKIWLSAGILMSLAVPISATFFPEHIRINGSPGGFLLSASIFAANLVALRLAMRPTSSLIRSLESVILTAISAERPNNSFKPTPLRGVGKVS